MSLKIEVLDYSEDQELLNKVVNKILGERKKLIFIVDETNDKFILTGEYTEDNFIEAERIVSKVDYLGGNR